MDAASKGESIIAFGVQARLDSASSFSVIKGNIANGYNKVACKAILTQIKGENFIANTVVFSQALLMPAAYVGMGSGIHLTKAPF